MWFFGCSAVAERPALARLNTDGNEQRAGYTDTPAVHDVALARYTPAGTPDTAISSDDMVTTDLGDQDYGHAVVLRPNGRITIAGSSSAKFVHARPGTRHWTSIVSIVMAKRREPQRRGGRLRGRRRAPSRSRP